MKLVADAVDFHVHSSPSVLDRHCSDAEVLAEARSIGVATIVLKAHEGFTAERAVLAGEGAVGGVVLNGTVGGANPDAVMVSAKLGGRVVWLPTISAPAHRRHSQSRELDVHSALSFREVAVVDANRVRDEWLDVLDVVAAYDQVLCSGHVAAAEALTVFQEAYRRGVRRFVVNHPLMPFLEWTSECAEGLRRLGAFAEVGVLPDLLTATAVATDQLIATYPRELLVFGSDLGHTSYPRYSQGVSAWVSAIREKLTEGEIQRVMHGNGSELLRR